jgi:hypothetical protein
MQRKSTYILLAVLCTSIIVNLYLAAERTSAFSLSGTWGGEKGIHQWHLNIEEKKGQIYYGTIAYWSDHPPVTFDFEGKKTSEGSIQISISEPNHSWAYKSNAEVLIHRNELGVITHLEDRTNDLFFMKQTSLDRFIRWLR